MIRTAGNRPAWRLGMTLVRSGGNHAIRGKPCSRVRTPAANPFAPRVGRPAFQQGDIPAQITNPLPDKALA